MLDDNRIIHGQYRQVQYLQFSARRSFRLAQTVIGIFSWPLVLPLAMISRLSDIVFRSCSEMLSIIPYFPGVIFRYEFYRFALRSCGRNVVIEFGTVFLFREVSIGSDVLIGRYNIIHHCDFGNYVLVGERCTFLSGSRQHGFNRTDIPMALQGGEKKRIRVGDDCWIGAHSVVMDDVGRGSIVGAGSIITKSAPAYAIMAGNPAKMIRVRESQPNDV